MKDKFVFTDHNANTTNNGMVEVYVGDEKITITVQEYLQYVCSDIDWKNYDQYTKSYLNNLIFNRKLKESLK